MRVLQRIVISGVIISAMTAACSAPPSPPRTNATLPPGLTCPVMTRVEYNHVRHTIMLGPSPEDRLICLRERRNNAPEMLVLNWYTLDRLRSSDVSQAVEVLSSLMTGPVGFKTNWNRFLGGGSFPYVTEFTVEPDQRFAVGDKTYDVRVITGRNSPNEDGETWISKEDLTILKYVDRIYPSKSYTATAIAKMPPS